MSTALAILARIWKFIRPFFASTADLGQGSFADLLKSGATYVAAMLATLIYTNGGVTVANLVIALAAALVKELQARLTPAS